MLFLELDFHLQCGFSQKEKHGHKQGLRVSVLWPKPFQLSSGWWPVHDLHSCWELHLAKRPYIPLPFFFLQSCTQFFCLTLNIHQNKINSQFFCCRWWKWFKKIIRVIHNMKKKNCVPNVISNEVRKNRVTNLRALGGHLNTVWFRFVVIKFCMEQCFSADANFSTCESNVHALSANKYIWKSSYLLSVLVFFFFYWFILFLFFVSFYWLTWKNVSLCNDKF